MKRIFAVALSVGALAWVQTGCGSDESPAASGARQGAPVVGTTAVVSTHAAAPVAPVTSRTDAAPATGTHATTSSLGPASQTTCGEFRTFGTEEEKALMEEILAENPGSTFEGSPNVALGTAKLVCLASSMADTPVPAAIGIVEK